MKVLRIALVAAAAPLSPAFGQVYTLLSFDHPGGPRPGWGQALVALGDLDGDGADELAVGTLDHGGGEAATVHSGRTGFLLFTLQAPAAPMFHGDAITQMIDETGDGLAEIAVLGSQSGAPGSPNGRILVYSGDDGALLRQVAPPAGYTLVGHSLSGTYSPGDVDGDGRGDLMCNALAPSGSAIVLFSSDDGQPIFVAAPASGFLVGVGTAQLSDHDGDGRADFALAAGNLGAATHVEIRSGATGALLAQIAPPGLDVLTGNREPFLGIADRDGDGRRDLAVGAIFTGRVAIYSTATGALLRAWDCVEAPHTPCFGSRLIEIGDTNGNGSAELVALESLAFGPGVRMFGIDPARKALVFDELQADLEGGYSSSDRLAPLPGVHLDGHPTFALFRDVVDQVSVMSFEPQFGTRR